MIAVAMTDQGWFDYLRDRPDLKEVNFWTPTPWNIRKLTPGDRFYFMLKAPVRKIGGWGEFVRYENMRAREAWEVFGTANGAADMEELIGRGARYAAARSRRPRSATNPEIGCVVLRNPVYLDERDFFEPEEHGLSFSPKVEKFKYFDIDAIPIDGPAPSSPASSTTYWVTVGPAHAGNFDLALQAGTWGVRDDAAGRLAPVREGDAILFYSKIHGFALCIATSPPFEDRQPIWPDDTYPHRIRISRPIRENRVLRVADVGECLRDRNGTPYASAQAAGRAIGGKGGTFRALTAPEIDCLFDRLGWDRPQTVAEPSGDDPVITMHLDLDWLVHQTLWPKEDLEELVHSLEEGSSQVVLAGPPGTGKTWVARHVARYVTGGRRDAVRIVQFHPSFGYEEFIEGLQPVSDGGVITFRPVPGVIPRMVEAMEHPTDLTVLVIDEMNRANLPRVFGELMYLLEYRGDQNPIDLQYRSGFTLPPGLKFIGTMNTADRSIRSIDIALRRRFDVFECVPDLELLGRYYAVPDRQNDVNGLIEGLGRLNARLTEELDRHHTIGHTFMMAEHMDAVRLGRVWRYKIGPLIEDYFFDQPDIADEYRLEEFWPNP